MRPIVKSEFIPFVTRFEPLIPWMSMNSDGQVVVGLGCPLEPIDQALKLPWSRRDGTEEISANEISGDWVRIKKNRLLAHKGPAGAAPYTNLMLTPKGLEQVVLARLDAIELMTVAPTFRTWEEWPADAQLATLSMAWVDYNLPEHFPKWVKAAKNHNWKRAAEQCSFATARRRDLIARNWAHRRLFVAAITTEDPDVLHTARDDDQPNQPSAA